MNKKPIEEYNIVRVLATILVVIGHAGYISPQTAYGGIEMFDYSIPIIQKMVDLGIRLIYSFHMPLFFALSGALFYKSISGGSVRSFGILFKSKCKRLLGPFFVCSLFWNIPIKVLSGYFSGSDSLFRDIVVGQLLLAGNTHLWFLWCLFVVTILAYVFRNYDKTRIFVAVVLFLIGGRIEFSFLGIQDILMNFVWFACGMLIHKNREELQQAFQRSKMLLTLGSALLWVVILLTYLLICKGNAYAYGMVKLSGVGFAFVIALRLKETNIMNHGWYRMILKHSFYIYLMADTINYPILAVIKRLQLRSALETNIGAGFLFVFRIIVPIFLAIVCECLLNKMRKFASGKRVAL